MLSYLWTLCCEATIVDARTNNVSFINLVDQLNGPANATLIPIKLGVCTMWRRDDPSGQDDVEYHLAWESPAGDRLFELPAGRALARDRAMCALSLRSLACRLAGRESTRW